MISQILFQIIITSNESPLPSLSFRAPEPDLRSLLTGEVRSMNYAKEKAISINSGDRQRSTTTISLQIYSNFYSYRFASSPTTSNHLVCLHHQPRRSPHTSRLKKSKFMLQERETFRVVLPVIVLVRNQIYTTYFSNRDNILKVSFNLCQCYNQCHSCRVDRLTNV